MDASGLEGSYVHIIPEFYRKLHDIGNGLPESDRPAVGFLRQAVCPRACIYLTTIHEVPSVSQCYHGLCRHSDTQAIAVSILLHVLGLVGARSASDDLQRIANDNQIEKDGADARKVGTLSEDARVSLHFRELLCMIYRQLPEDEKLAVINLSCPLLKPLRHPQYTRSLLVHFMVMMQQKLISPSDIQPLHECLLIIGQMEIIDLINSYYMERGLPQLPTREIERKDAKKGAAPARPATPRLDCVVEPGPPPTRPNVATGEPPTDSSEIVEREIFLHSTQESGLGRTGALVSHEVSQRNYPTQKSHEGRGDGFQIFTKDTVRDEPCHKPDIPKVEFLETRRLSQRIAYVKWQPVTQQDAKYTVEVVSSGKEEEKEATLETETKTNEFVARELEGDKEYTMTISAKSSEGDIIATGTHSIPLPKNENVPTPQGVRVTGATKSLRVKWDVVQPQSGVEGYSVTYYPTPDASSATGEGEKEMISVDGVRRTTVVLDSLQPNTTYSVQVAVRMSGDMVGPYSNPETGKTKTSKTSSKAICCLSFMCIIFLVAIFIASVAVLAIYSVSHEANHSFNITQGDTIDLGVYSIFRYDSIKVSSERISTLTVYRQDTECNNLPVHPNTSYGYEASMNFSTTETTTFGVNPANGYFAHNSMPIFQLNASGPLPLTNCSAAFYFFDNPAEFDDFRFFGKTSKSIGMICFDVVNNTLDFSNTSVVFSVESSTYLYIGLYLQGVTHISLRISGTQNMYRHTDFANATQCVIDPDTPDCSFMLPRSLSHVSNDVCVLAYWEPSPSVMRQLITTKASYDVSSSFPHNIAQLLSLVFGIVAFTCLIVATIVCVVSACIYRR